MRKNTKFNSAFPHFLQKKSVAQVFNLFEPLSDDEIENLTEFFRLIWKIEQRQLGLQAARLELARTLMALKKRKIEIETQKLQEQILKLNSL